MTDEVFERGRSYRALNKARVKNEKNEKKTGTSLLEQSECYHSCVQDHHVDTVRLCLLHSIIPIAAIHSPRHQAASSTEGEVGLPPSPDVAVELSPILKYEDPVLARPHPGFDMTMGHDALPQYLSLYASNDQQQPRAAAGRLVLGGGGGGRVGSKAKRRPYGGEDNSAVLKAIIPNKEWVDEAGEWVQTVGFVPRFGAMILRPSVVRVYYY